MERKYSKRTAVFIGIAGFISACNFLLAPVLHEVWHILISLFHGYIPTEIHWTWIETQDTSLSMQILPSYIEVIMLFSLFAYFLHKGKRYLASYFMGYMYPFVFLIILFTGIGMKPDDYSIAMRYHNSMIVTILWYSWELFTLFLIGLEHYLLKLYRKEGVRQGKALQKGILAI